MTLKNNIIIVFRIPYKNKNMVPTYKSASNNLYVVTCNLQGKPLSFFLRNFLRNFLRIFCLRIFFWEFFWESWERIFLEKFFGIFLEGIFFLKEFFEGIFWGNFLRELSKSHKLGYFQLNFVLLKWKKETGSDPTLKLKNYFPWAVKICIIYYILDLEK